MTTARSARVASAYQRLREHLAYLGLTTAAEQLAPVLEHASAERRSPVEVLEELLAAEAEATRRRKLAGRLRFAHYPLPKSLVDFEFDYQPSIDRAVVAELSTLRFVEDHRNVLLLGPPGVGKTMWPSRWESLPPRPATEPTSRPPPTWWLGCSRPT